VKATYRESASRPVVTGEDRTGLKEVKPVGDLSVLTPPLLVCAAFLIALGLFLRHEMGTSRRHRDQDVSDDISGDGTIPDSASSQATAHSDDADASRAE
jgi:hypothetical protein